MQETCTLPGLGRPQGMHFCIYWLIILYHCILAHIDIILYPHIFTGCRLRRRAQKLDDLWLDSFFGLYIIFINLYFVPMDSFFLMILLDSLSLSLSLSLSIYIRQDLQLERLRLPSNSHPSHHSSASSSSASSSLPPGLQGAGLQAPGLQDSRPPGCNLLVWSQVPCHRVSQDAIGCYSTPDTRAQVSRL